METFYVVRESDGDTYASETFAGAVIAAQPGKRTRFVDAAIVDAPDAGAARLLIDNEGSRRSDLRAPRPWTLWSLDVWGNRRSRAGTVFLSDDMEPADVRALLADDGYNMTGASVEWTDDGYIEINATDDGKPLLTLERDE